MEPNLVADNARGKKIQYTKRTRQINSMGWEGVWMDGIVLQNIYTMALGVGV